MRRLILTLLLAPLGIVLMAAIVWELLNEPANTTNTSCIRSTGNNRSNNCMGVLMLWTATKSYFACAWSAFSYIIFGMPKDKESYWKNKLGFNDPAPELLASWSAYKKDPDFHHLKDIGVEWTKVWPQRAFKVTALFGCIFALITFLFGISIGIII